VRRANVRIRPAEREDVDGLAALTQSIDTSSGTFSGRGLIKPDLDHLITRFDEILDEDSRFMLVACDEQSGEVVGLLLARREEIGAIDVTPALHISHLLVMPNHRRRGIGAALLVAAVHLAEEQGVDRVLATVSSASRDANRYLSRLGFAPLVIQRVASTGVLRRALGLMDEPQRVAMLRRARLTRAQRARPATQMVDRGA